MRYYKIPIIEDGHGNFVIDANEKCEFDLIYYFGDNENAMVSLINGIAKDSWEEISIEEFDKIIEEDNLDVNLETEYVMENKDFDVLIRKLDEFDKKLSDIESSQKAMIEFVMRNAELSNAVLSSSVENEEDNDAV